MGGMSPVLEAFFTGQANQQKNLENAQAYQLKKEQLDQAIKEFQANHDLAQRHMDLLTQEMHLKNDMAHMEAENNLRKLIQEGSIPVPNEIGQQTQGINLPGMNPGSYNGPPLNSLPGVDVHPAPVGTPMSFNTPMGNITINRPMTNVEQAVAQQRALLPGQLETKKQENQLDIDKYLQTIGSTKTQELENKANLAEAHNSLMSDYYDKLMKTKDSQIAMMGTVAQMRADAQMNSMLIRMGYGSPEQIQNNSMNYATRARLGLLSPDEEKLMNPAEKTGFKAILTNNNSQHFDYKQRNTMDANLSSGASLLNDFNELNNKYPAAQSFKGRAVNKIATLPGISWTNDMGQEFNKINANIANLAKQTGESPSMARSVALAKKAEAAQIAPTDSPDVRNEKYNKLGDLMLDVVQGGIQNVADKQQRIDIWKSELDKPALQMLKKNIAFKSVFEKILRNGTYDPTLIGK